MQLFNIQAWQSVTSSLPSITRVCKQPRALLAHGTGVKQAIIAEQLHLVLSNHPHWFDWFRSGKKIYQTELDKIVYLLLETYWCSSKLSNIRSRVGMVSLTGHIFRTGQKSLWPWPWPVMTGQVQNNSVFISYNDQLGMGKRISHSNYWCYIFSFVHLEYTQCFDWSSEGMKFEQNNWYF